MPTLVLIHGLFSSPLEFSLVTRWLTLRGVRFELLEVPGYTRGGVARSTWKEWVDAARAAIEARFAPGEPIVVGGLCVGGVIAAALTETPCRPSIQGLVMLSPTLRIDGWGVTRWRHLRTLPYLFGFDRWITIREREPFGIKNIRMRHWIRRELETNRFSSVGPATLPLWGIRESERLSAHVRRGLGELDVPLLVVHARDDEIASLASVKRWMQSVRSHAQLAVLEASYHMVTMDNDRREVAQCLADFLGTASARVQAPPVESTAAAARPLDRSPPMRLADLVVHAPQTRHHPFNEGTTS